MTMRHAGLVAVYLGLVGLGWFVGRGLADFAMIEVLPQTEARVHATIMTGAVAFVVASALPFVPGAEIGFGLILMFGAQLAYLVYVSMVAALTLAFLVGRLVPVRMTAAAFSFFGLNRARQLALRLEPLDRAGRLELLMAQAPVRAVPYLLRYRYVALALILNMPGNSVIGGGGGIAFAAGMSGLFSVPAFFATVLVAVAPVPLFFAISHSTV